MGWTTTRLGLAVLFMTMTACRTGSGGEADAVVSAAGQTGALPEGFLAAWREYLGFYSKNHHAQLAAKRPEVKQVLFGDQNGPYDVQGFDPDAALQGLDFAPRDPLQYNPGCAPTFVQARKLVDGQPVPYQGTVVLFHGYTACPQQLYEMAVRLSRIGFHAVIPLLPGQGRAPIPAGPQPQEPPAITNRGQYWGQYLPTDRSWERYRDYVTYVNGLVATLPGRKFAGGLSGGAALAQYAALQTEGAYEGVLVMAPYFMNPGSYAGRKPSEQGAIRRTINRWFGDAIFNLRNLGLQVLKDYELSWGQNCYDENHYGRRGICDFKARNVAGLNRFGGFVRQFIAAEVPRRQRWPRTQYIMIEWDSAADTKVARETFEAQRSRWSDQLALCFYRDLPHSFFSRQDNRDIPNMYWLPSFYEQSLRFFASGDFLEQDGESSEREGSTPYRLCRIPDGDRPAEARGLR